ncbi:NADH-quinone oxidoreductase subunit F [Variovorax sp. B4]|nr:NADH-quinone oxidoreductase subunit F [Variovorax sp. B2]PNG51474.1 NADH-quinone oxidoreductase subunit F [Variovorax sp. B4]
MAAEVFLDEVQAAGLCGKGGANFSSARKMQLFREQAEPTKHLVINGGEHEPGSAKDDWLLTHHADTVLDGALCLAHLLGATHVWVAINARGTAAQDAVTSALNHITREMHPLPVVRIVTVPDEYVAGEETALLQSLSGRPAMPVRRPPFPIERGHDDKPTLVHNVETVAHLPYLILHGAQAYRQLGIARKGVTLCTFGDEFVHSGVRLVPLGIDIHALLQVHGGGLRSGRTIRAVQPGGPASGFLHREQFDVLFEAPSLMRAGSSLGCAAISGFSEDDDMVSVTRSRTDFFEKSSCGQCPQCRMQTRMLAAIVRQVEAGKGSAKLLGQIPLIIQANAAHGICGLIRMPVAPVESLLRHFKTDIDRHLPAESA